MFCVCVLTHPVCLLSNVHKKKLSSRHVFLTGFYRLNPDVGSPK